MARKRTLPIIQQVRLRRDRLELDERLDADDAENVLDKLGSADLSILGDSGGYDPYDSGTSGRTRDSRK